MSRKDKYIISNELKAPKQVVDLCLNTSAKPGRTLPGMSHGQAQVHGSETTRHQHANRTFDSWRGCVSGAASHTHTKKIRQKNSRWIWNVITKQQQNKKQGTEKVMGKQNSAPTSSVHLWCLSVVVALKLRHVSRLWNYTPTYVETELPLSPPPPPPLK